MKKGREGGPPLSASQLDLYQVAEGERQRGRETETEGEERREREEINLKQGFEMS